jgi:Mg-chelatase subunit ChlD
MSYKDCRISRLAASQKALEKYVRARAAISPDDRIAVVSFSTSARIDMPLTGISKAEGIIPVVMKLKGDGGTDIATGIETAGILLNDAMTNDGIRRLQRILLLTDGRGGSPLSIANEVKSRGVLIDVIGIGGKPSAVDETLLRWVATTDADGFNHYWFIKDADSLVQHYQQLATSLVWRPGPR